MRLDEAFLFAQSIDATSYGRQRDELREKLVRPQIGPGARCSPWRSSGIVPKERGLTLKWHYK